jgi:hypothetical protein
MYPSTTDITFPLPLRFTIADQYGESLTFSSSPNIGDVLTIAGGDYDEDGEIGSVRVVGNFHGTARQNSFNSVQRLKSMKKISEREDQHLIFLCPHPVISIRGYLGDFNGPNWGSTPHNKFFDFSFDFNRAPFPRQIDHFAPLTDVVPSEGKPYVYYTVTADTTNVRDLMYQYLGRSRADFRSIRKVLEYNRLTPAQARALPLGSSVKVPRL